MSSETSASIQRQLGETTFIEPSGGILTEQLIQKLRNESCSEDAVQPKTFQYPGERPSTTSELEGRISEAWDDLEERWDEVTRDNELFGMDVSEARQRWILKLFEALDFEPEYQQANLSAGELEASLSHFGWPRNDSVTASADTPEATPPILHTIEPDGGHPLDDGDHEGAASRQQSPHDELQRYLNATDDVQWSIVTDGLKLRVLRDYYHTYTRGYVEFDLENIFTNRNYDDFRALYRLCHASRFIPRGDGDEAEAPLESLYQVALATGVKVGEDLQSNVVEALETLGNGFLNQDIREALEEGGQEEAEAYYQDLLRIVYRLLFLLFAEQRGMMADRGDLYTKEYSISALRERAERKQSRDHQTDLWEGLKVTFHLVGQGVDEDDLQVPGYNGGLFDDENLSHINKATCPNGAVLSAVHNLTHVEQQGYQQRISYADLGVDEIGAVYESLLEFTPQLADTALDLDDRSISRGQFYLDDRGMERKETGSYYTKPELVSNLIESSLKPVVDRKLEDCNSVEEKEDALLSINVCDPACGSGAFLIAANNYLGKRLAEIRSGSAYPSEKLARRSRRSVVRHCIYGVDLNPMAVELAKVSLWINSAVEDKPLNFLDHRIKQGNSLIGATPELIANGLPDSAFDTSKGRDFHVGTEIRRLVRNESDLLQSELSWYDETDTEYVSLTEKLDKISEENIIGVEQKREIYDQVRETEAFKREKLAHDIWTAAFYWPLEDIAPRIEESGLDKDEYLQKNEDEFPTPKTIEKARQKLPRSSSESIEQLNGLELLRKRTRHIAERESFFHWNLEFPNVFANFGGFDCVLGNPPWDKLTIELDEFFAVRAPDIADPSLTQAERKEKVDSLQEHNPDLYDEYQQAVISKEASKRFIKESGRFPTSSHGILNLYAPFAELGLETINSTGRTGIVVQTGIATDSHTQEFFRKLVNDHRLVSLYDFVKDNKYFNEVDKKFCLLTLIGEDNPQQEFELAFYLEDLEGLQEEQNRFSISPEEIKLVNPNTETCPTFRTRQDAELSLEIYRNSSILKNETDKEDVWGVELRRMFNSGDDSNLFERKEDLDRNGWNLDGNVFSKPGGEFVPVYESKMIHQYDHRFKTYRGVSESDVKNKNPTEVDDKGKKDPNYRTLPPYWVSYEDYENQWNDDSWHIVLRKVARATDKRTSIASVLPQVATEDSVNHLLNCDSNDAPVVLACLNSFVLDYAARRKVGGANLNQYIAKQLPIPKLTTLQDKEINGEPLWTRISRLSNMLTYTSSDLSTYANDVDIEGGPFDFQGPNGREREDVRMELEAILCHAYGLDEGDIRHVLADFSGIRDEEMEEYGEYRTKNKIIQKFNEFSNEIEW
jgi:type I restriction-modification system DNA methylase subunit